MKIESLFYFRNECIHLISYFRVKVKREDMYGYVMNRLS